MTSKSAHILSKGIALALLASCGGGSDYAGTSSLTVGLTDAPTSRAGVQSVFITVTGIEVQPGSGMALSFPLMNPLTVDLLTLQKGNIAALVNNAMIPSGDYQWMRLDLDTSAGKDYVLYCADGTTTCAAPATIALTIPSGAETGLKIVRGFTLPANGALNLLVDFNVDRSIVPLPNGNPWHLKPTLRVIASDAVGTIQGTISAMALQNAAYSQTACSAMNPPAVYVYPATSATMNAIPDDIFTGTEEANEMAVPPVATQVATYNANDGTATFSIPWLVADAGANNYTVAFTCDPDDPAVDETAIVPPATAATISFNIYPTPVMVSAGMTAMANFQ